MRVSLFNYIKEFLIRIFKSRIFVLYFIFAIFFVVIFIRVFDLQIIKNDYYMSNYIQKAQKPIYTAGTRGNIYDRNGQILASNKLSYTVTIEDVMDSGSDKNKNLNAIIDKTIKIIEENGDSLTNDFPIILNAAGEPEYSLDDGSAKSTFLSNVYGLSKEKLKAEKLDTASATKVFKYLCSDKKYEVSNDYTMEEKLKILAVRYNLSLNYYQKYITTTIASDVSDATVAAIYENSDDLQGVTISEQSERVYDQSIYFAHILGYTGQISEEQLAEYNKDNDSDYIAGDIVGKSGIEKVMDSYLQGTRGEETVFVDSLGRILESTDKTDPEAGNDVYLTIDKDLQVATYKILEQKLAGILYSKIVDHEVTPTKDMKSIPIPVKDVYFQIINNNMVDLTKFSLATASDNEKNIYAKYLNKYNSVIDTINSNLTDSSSKPQSSLSEENKTYLSYIYDMLSSSGVIDESSIDTDDDTYTAWTNETISLRNFLMYAISKNWIDTSLLESDKKYASSDEVYNSLVAKILEDLGNDTGFSKKIYYYLIYSGAISGNEACRLLYDQGVLEYDEGQYNQLKNGNSTTAYNFIKEQIRLLKITPAQVALDPCSGSCVVTDTDTGDVLALVTYPSYDNNMLSGTVDASYWKQLNNDLSLPLYNRATQTRTAPGSTFKMVTAITGLEEGAITPDTTVTDKGEFTLIGTPAPKCWIAPGSHGTINVSQALEVSCNYFFYQVGYWLSLDPTTKKYDSDLGLSKLKKYAEELGLDMKSGVEIEENEPLFSTVSSVPSAIGQGSNAFADIQLARYINTVANSGKNYQLTLLDKVADTQGNVVKQYEPNLTNTVDASQSTWDAVHTGMRMVITGGTAKNIFSGFQIEVAGKSGTAQENLLRSNHTVFLAYAPYSQPEISVSVLIPYGDSSGYAGELTKEVISYYFNLTTQQQVDEGTAAVPESGVTSD